MRGRRRIDVAPCKFCSRQFKRQEHLQRHERTHTQEKPFACSCGRSFSRQDLLGRHRRLAHPEDYRKSLIEAQRPPHIEENGIQAAQQSSPWSIPDAESNGGNSVPNTNHHRQRSSVSAMPADQAGPLPNSAGVVPRGETILEFDNSNAFDLLQESAFDFDFIWDDAAVTDSLFFGTAPALNDESASLAEAAPDGDILPREAAARATYNSSSRALTPTTTTHTQPRIPSLSAKSQTQLQEMHQKAIGPCEISESINVNDLNPIHGARLTTPWTISPTAYDGLIREIESCKDSLLDTFSLPSAQSLSRYLEGYFRGFHPHLPFLHLPTTSPESMTPRLLVALAAVGAFYRFEHPQGYSLYFASRALINQHREGRRRQQTSHLTDRYPSYAEISTSGSVHDKPHYQSCSRVDAAIDLETIQAMLVLTLLTVWVDSPVIQDGFEMAGQLAVLVRETGLLTSTDSSPREWAAWHRVEAKRRTLYSVFILTNLITISYCCPPMVPNWEIDLPLPCSTAEWEAADAEAWNSAKRHGRLQHLSFNECLRKLLTEHSLDKEISITAFGNYVLVHGLLQQLYYERNASRCMLNQVQSFPDSTIHRYREALRGWQRSWETTRESTLDPTSPYGPMAFNSTAVLRLAHIRLSVDLGKRHALTSRDPQWLAQAFTDGESPVSLRMPHVENAVLQCLHALSVLVRVGIAFVARTRTAQWSVQHAISSFECALLLTRWLQCLLVEVRSSGISSLKDEEKHLLGILTNLVQETHLADTLHRDQDPCHRIRQLAIAALELWSESCKGVQVFEIVDVIGKTLSCVAANLKAAPEIGSKGQRLKETL